MKGSLIIIGFFILGIICGMTGIIPADVLEGDISLYALCALMFCVGVGIGNDPGIIKSFRQLPKRLMLLPVATILEHGRHFSLLTCCWITALPVSVMQWVRDSATTPCRAFLSLNIRVLNLARLHC